jgi:hypothetical protein
LTETVQSTTDFPALAHTNHKSPGYQYARTKLVSDEWISYQGWHSGGHFGFDETGRHSSHSNATIRQTLQRTQFCSVPHQCGFRKGVVGLPKGTSNAVDGRHHDHAASISQATRLVRIARHTKLFIYVDDST